MNKKLLIAFGLIGILALGLTGAALADQGDPPAAPYDDCLMGDGYGLADGMAYGDGVMHETVIELYADALGLSVEELEARLEAGETLVDIALDLGFTFEDLRSIMTDVHVQMLDAALADGSITQEQYDWMIERGKSRRDRVKGFGPQDRPGLYNFELKPEVVAAIADALGINAEDLQTRLDAGETIREIAVDLGFTADDYEPVMTTIKLNLLDQALADSKITQDQYDQMKSRIEDGLGDPGGFMMDGFENGSGFDGTGHGGRGRGGMPGGFDLDS